MSRGDVLVRMKADTSSYNAGLASANKTLSQFKQANLTMGGAISQLTKSLTTAAAGYMSLAAAGSAISGMVKESVAMAKAGEGIRLAFQRLNRPDLLDGLRQATHNTITDIDLMKAAVRFDDFKLSLDDMGTMLAFAQQKAKDTGQSVDYMVESITMGLGRQSKQILDNLGISASEITKRMKDGGDMTKAVAEIIREQMSKAGDYVETAAERATQAEVALKNEMEAMGQVFGPLTEAANGFFNAVQIGAVKALTAIGKMLNSLRSAGRANNAFYGSGLDKDVQKGLGKLKVAKANGSDYMTRSLYNDQVEGYNRRINDLDAQINNGGKRPGAGSGESRDVRWLQGQRDALIMARDQYMQEAEQILNPIVNTTTIDIGGGTGGDKKGGGGKTDPTYAADSIAAQEKLVQDLNKAWREAGSGVRDSYLPQIVEAEAKLKTMKDEQELLKEQAAGRLKGSPDGQGLEIPLTSDVAFDEWMGGVVEKLENLEIDPIKIPIETTTKDVKSIAVAARMTADVVGSIGDAFNAIEDPAAKVMGTVMQAIASVALGYAQATAQAGSMGPWVWLAFAASGLATMIATISTIHSQTGYAEGGMIKGNSYSGDNIGGVVDGSQFVGLNAGEVVLNAAQQSSLAQQLEGGAMQNLRLDGVISGENIHIVHNRYLKRSGQGEIVTW